MDETMFPEEGWMAVLSYLGLGDLCRVALVSRFFHRLATDPCLWKQAGSCLNKEKVRTKGLVTFFKVPRFKKIFSLDISESTPSACLDLVKFLTCPEFHENKIKEVNLRYVDLSQIPSKQLAAAICKLRKVDLEFTRLTRAQCMAIAQQLQCCGSLVDLSLADVDLLTLSSLSCHLLTRDKGGLNKLNLEYSNLGTDQCSTILRTIIRCSNILDLNLGGVNLSQVKSSLLGESVLTLEKINLRNCDLSKQQCTRIFSEITRSDKLVELNLSENDLSEQQATLLSSAAIRLHTVDLSNCWLSMEQCSALLLASMKETRLRDIKLGGNELLDTRFSHVNVPGFSIVM